MDITFIDYLKDLQAIMNKIPMYDPEAIIHRMSLDDVHAPGMFSLVLDQKDDGGLIRVFIATEKIAPMDIQLHFINVYKTIHDFIQLAKDFSQQD